LGSFRKTILFSLCGLLATTATLAQRNVKDSLTALLKKELPGKDRVNVLNQLAYQYYDFNDSLASEYASKAFQLATQIGYQRGLKYAYTMIGLGYSSKSEYRKAIYNYRKSEQIHFEGKEDISSEISYNLALMGNCYREMANFDSSLYYYRKAKLSAKDSPHDLASIYKNMASVNLILWKNSEALGLLDTASQFLKNNKLDSKYVQMDIWSYYGQVYKNLANYPLSLKYYEKMCHEANLLEDYYHQITCKLNQAELAFQQSNFTTALNFNFEALDITRKYVFPPQYVKVVIQIGEVYEELSQFDLAAEYFFRALKITEALGLQFETATIYSQLAWIKKDQHDYAVSLQYANKSLAIREKIGDAKGIGNCHNVIGLVYLLKKDFARSLKEHETALKIRQEIGYTLGISASIFNMSLVYEEQGQFQKALEYQLRSSLIEEKIDNKQSIGITYNSLARLLLKMGRLDEALQYVNKADKFSKETGSLLLMRNNANIYVIYYQTVGNYKKAYEYQKLFQSLNDSIYSDVSALKLAEVEAIYNVEKKEKDIELLKQKQEAQMNQLQLQEAELSRKNWILASSTVGIFVLIAAGIVGYRYYKEKSKANRELREQKEEIQAQSEELMEATATISNINKELEMKIESRTSELKQAYKELDTFFYRSSHDFRRPITTFLGLAGVARITVKDPVSLELFEKVSETAGSLDKMLYKLQSISDVGSQQMVFKEVFLRELVNEILDGFAKIIQQKRIAVHTDIQEEATLISYPAMVKIIVENLIENAIHFSAYENPVITIRATVNVNVVILEVEDNGQGILEEYKPRIFEMYFRANENSKGNGLGLYIAKKAIEKLSGHIRVTSTHAQGSVFTVELPNRQE
jgi:pentatricopeptide repeat protein